MPKKKNPIEPVIGSIAGNNSGSIGAINVYVVLAPIAEPKQSVVVEKYADGTIGRNAHKRNYVDYLIRQYYEFTKAGISFGEDPEENASKVKTAYKRTISAVIKNFGASPNYLTEDKFEALCQLLAKRVDQTVLGRVRKHNSSKNYSTFAEFQEKGLVLQIQNILPNQ